MAGTSADICMSGSAHQDVSSLVSRFGGGQFPPRHGIAERGRYRLRSRERMNSQPATGTRSETRHHPSGPQETIDWIEALESYETRLATVERFCRMHGQTIAASEEMSVQHRKATKTCNDDIVNYKAYVERTFNKIGAAYEQQKVKIGEQDNAINIGINDTLNALTEKCRILEASHQS